MTNNEDHIFRINAGPEDDCTFDNPISLPNNFLFCSVPTVTVVDVIPLTFNIEIPDINLPFCPCPNSVTVDHTGQIDLNITAPEIQLTFWNASDDCCLPVFTLELTLAIPCLPLFPSGVAIGYSTGTVICETDFGVQVSHFIGRKEDVCELTFDLDVKVPCMPYTATGVASATFTPDREFIATFNIERICDEAEGLCGLSYEFDLAIPCIGFTIQGTGEGTIAIDRRDISIYVVAEKVPETCAISLDIDIEIPCLPLLITANGEPFMIVDGITKYLDPYLLFTLGIRRDPRNEGECEFLISYRLEIPCLPYAITVTGTDAIVVDGIPMDLHPDLLFEMGITRPTPGTCEFLISYRLDIPCLPLGVKTTGTATFIDPSDPVQKPALAIRPTKTPNCTLVLSYVLELPCLPLGVSATGTATFIDPSDPDQKPDIEIALTKTPSCTLIMSYKLEIPCLPLGVTRARPGQFPDVTFTINPNITKITGATLVFTKTPECTLEFDFGLEIPCLPIKITKATQALVDPANGYPSQETFYKPPKAEPIHLYAPTGGSPSGYQQGRVVGYSNFRLDKDTEKCEFKITWALWLLCPVTINFISTNGSIKINDNGPYPNHKPQECEFEFDIEADVAVNFTGYTGQICFYSDFVVSAGSGLFLVKRCCDFDNGLLEENPGNPNLPNCTESQEKILGFSSC